MNNWTIHDEAIESFYESFRSEYLSVTSKYPLSTDERIDIYQEAIIVLYEAIKENKIKDQHNLKAYLFGTCRNMIRNRIKLSIIEREQAEFFGTSKDEAFYIDNPDQELNPVQEKLHDALQKLTESCRKILILFYYRQYSIEAIMHSMDYNNENVTKSHKSRCLKSLRQIMHDKN